MNKIEYEISPHTMAIVGEQTAEGIVHSRIIEASKEEYRIECRPTVLVDKSCKYFGSSLKGRFEGTKEICGITHKPPVAIDPTSGIYMFPTTSPYKETCAWIAHSYITKYHSIASDKIKVLLNHHVEVELHISAGSFENQLNRTAQFRYLLSNRIKI